MYTKRLSYWRDIMSFDKHLRNAKVEEAVIEQIMNVDYPKDKDEKKDNANFMAAAMHKCEELLDYDTVSKAMYDRACCKSGVRLKNVKAFAKEFMDHPLDEKLERLSGVPYMGKASLNVAGELELNAVGSYGYESYQCPCWNFNGARPINGPMPLSYCKCCGGHFRFHYQHALGIKLRLKEVKSSILNSEGKTPCVFLYEIIK
jgi:hypothetical protein